MRAICKFTPRLFAMAVGVALLAANTGCVEWLLATHGAAFGAGYVLGAATAGSQQECFVNGEPVDCSTLDVVP